MKLWLGVGLGVALQFLATGMSCCPLPEVAEPLVLNGAVIRTSLGEWRDEDPTDGLGPAETAGAVVVQILYDGGDEPYRFDLLNSDGGLIFSSDEPTFYLFPTRSGTDLVRVTDGAGVTVESPLTIKVLLSP